MNPQAAQNVSEDEAIEHELIADGSDSSPEQPSTKSRRPRGKIARLAKADRDQVNFMLRDGVAYAEILEKVGEPAKGIIPRNVSSWHTGPGYARWLQDQEWLEDMRADQESGLDLLPDFDAGKFNEAALQVAVTQLFRAFRHLGSGQLKEKLGGDPQGFARLVNALARACRETVNLQKHRDASAKAVAAELKRLDPNREFNDREHDLFLKKVEELFHIKLPRPEKKMTNDEPPVES
jgi:hypothetical protein